MKKRTNKYKCKKIQQSDDSGDNKDSGDVDYNDDNSTLAKSGVGKPFDDSTSNLGISDSDEYVCETKETAKPPTYGIDLDLGPYWNQRQIYIC